MEQYFYFGEATVETTGEAACIPLSNIIGIRPDSASSIKIYHKATDGTGDADNITLTHTGTSTKVAMNELVKVLTTKTNKPVVVVVDRLGTANAVDATRVATAIAVFKS
tara:strand:- start:124 stop:450 length:327 start_codon:yes stop_codon:yes gene_type:complete